MKFKCWNIWFLLIFCFIGIVSQQAFSGGMPVRHSGTMKFSQSDHAAQVFIPCKDPRPEVCTMEYDPVCGRKKDKSTATYSNACEACADPMVLGYFQGGCSE